MAFLILFIPWTLYLWGLIYLVTQSTIFSGPRVYMSQGSWIRAEFLYCPSCVGFWVGVCLTPYWPFAVGWEGYIGSGVAALAMGRLWGVLAGDSTFQIERKLLDLPGDTNDTTTQSEGV